MIAYAEIGSQTHYRPHAAVLLYAGGGDNVIATLHSVDASGERGELALEAGELLSTAFVRELSRRLGDGRLTPEVLPANVLCRAADRIVWWTPRQRRPMFFRGGREEFEGLTGKVYPHPALVWRVVEGRLAIRALAEDRRPTAETPLFIAPYPNQYEDRTVCLGSMRRPADLSVSSIDAWVDGYFASDFNTLGAVQTAHPDGFRGLWGPLAGRRCFPVQHLKSAGQTLGAFVES